MNNSLLEVLGYLVLPILGSIFVFFILFYSFSKMGCDKHPVKSVKWLVLVIYTAAAIAVSIPGNGIINLIMLLLFAPLIGHLFYHGSRTYLTYYILLTLIIYLLDAFLNMLYVWLIYKGVFYFSDQVYYNILYITTSKLITFAAAKIFVSIVVKRERHEISRNQYFGTLFLPACSIIYLYTMIFFMQVYAGPEHILLFVVNVVLLLALNFYFTRMLEVIYKNNHLQNELNLYAQQEEMQYRYYEELERKFEESRKVIHDIRNHMLALENLYQKDNTVSAGDYAEEIHNSLNKLGQKYYSSNKLLNIILNDKGQIMESHGIAFDARIGAVNWEGIKKTDMTTLFGNLLDNAIEAANEAEKKEISLIVDKVREFISISIGNTLLNEPKKEQKGFLSLKSEHQGLGLKNVERVIQKFNGDIHYDYDDTRFLVKIMIPLGGEEI